MLDQLMFDELSKVPGFMISLFADGNEVLVEASVSVCVPKRLIGTVKRQVPPDIFT